MLEEILNYRNIQKALKQVISNGGAGGVDAMETEALHGWVETNWMEWKQSILEGRFSPQPVRKVEIPKTQGGKRMLGIPCVRDRLVQQAIKQWLTPLCEPGFSTSSYGFREGRNAHQAVYQALSYLQEGKEWVIELDLEKFFDRVNHDKLMGLLVKRIADRRTLKLIRSYLNSGIMEGGLVSVRTEGVPQGSPLSPLLSNIMLNELDRELQNRGHSFIRYADDVSIYIKSERSARRAMTSIIGYLEERLKLVVNQQKSKLGQAEQSNLLGFSFYHGKDGWGITIAPKSLKRIKEKIRERTRRSDPTGTKDKIRKLETVIVGWVNYFRIARVKKMMQVLDRMVGHRLRMGIWKQWKTPQNRAKNLRKLGIKEELSREWGKGSRRYCRTAYSFTVQKAIGKKTLQRAGYLGFANHYYWKTTHQTTLF